MSKCNLHCWLLVLLYLTVLIFSSQKKITLTYFVTLVVVLFEDWTDIFMLKLFFFSFSLKPDARKKIHVQSQGKSFEILLKTFNFSDSCVWDLFVCASAFSALFIFGWNGLAFAVLPPWSWVFATAINWGTISVPQPGFSTHLVLL